MNLAAAHKSMLIFLVKQDIEKIVSLLHCLKTPPSAEFLFIKFFNHLIKIYRTLNYHLCSILHITNLCILLD